MLVIFPKHVLAALCLSLCLMACGKTDEKTEKAPSPTLVSVATAQTARLEIREEAVGTLEGLMDPTVAAEVAARVLKVLVHPGQTVKKGDVVVMLDNTDFILQGQEARAEVARIQALLTNQGKVVERNQKLVNKNFISQNALDDITTQQSALNEQLAGARARLAGIDHVSAKTRVIAPLDGVVEMQIVSVGDFVKIGDPLIQIISKQKLRAHLPFPENIAAKLQPGLKVRLTTPTSSNEVITTIRELKPLIGTNSLSVDIVADVIDQPGWQPGASVNGVVILAEHAEAVVVPEQSLVLRPAGEVVYLIKNDTAEQRVVKTGLRQNGQIEILEGLSAGEQVAVDGAAFLTDKAPVKIAPKVTSKNSKF